MPGFCRNCGAPLTGAFCVKCGQPADAPSALSEQAPSTPVVAAPVAPAAVPAPAKGSGLGKVLLIVGLIFGLFVVVGVGAAFYAVHWAKKKVASYSAAVTGGSNPNQVTMAHGNSCRLLSKSELQEVLGVPIEKTEEISEGDTPGCAYFTNSDGFAQLREMAVEETKRESARASAEQKPGEKIDNPLELLKHTKDMEGMVKTLGMQQPPEDGQVFSFTVDRRSGSETWSSMRATMAIIPGFEEIHGVGDHAMIGSFGHTFCALKANTAISLNTLYVPDARTRGADIARRILARL